MEWFLESASTFAGDIDFVIELIFWITMFWLVLAEAILIWFVVKFHHTNNPTAQYITGEKKEEMKFIHWPHNLVLVCDIIIIIFAIKTWYGVKQVLPPADNTIHIIGNQWAWTFVHSGPDGQLGTADDVETTDEMHVTVDTTYHFKLTSPDVMHSFSVPVFRLKQDIVPGREITGWFNATKTGEWDLQCAEMCGIGHGIMAARIFVETKEDHAIWLSRQAGKMAQN